MCSANDFRDIYNFTTATSQATVIISRNGDLVHNVWVRCNQDTSHGISGDYLVEDVEVEIGGQRIDKLTREWGQIWPELSTPISKVEGYKYLTGAFNNTLISGNTLINGGTQQQQVMVPLQFWFCRNIGLALPLIALQYHEVKLLFTWGKGDAWISGTSTSGLSRSGSGTVSPAVEVWVDYIYLDTDERRRFAQVSHEYLIEQLQVQSEGTAATEYKLNFEHPVKELLWTNTSSNITSQKIKLELNGHDRFTEQTKDYFQLVQPYKHHTTIPGYNIKETERPQILTTPLIAGPYQLQALSGNDSTAASTALGSDDQASFGILASITADGNITETTAASQKTLIIREATVDQSFKVGDMLLLRLNDANVADNSQVFTITSMRADTGGNIVSGKTFQELTLDRNPLTLHAAAGTATTIADGDDLIITIIGRTQNPQSRCSCLAKDINVYSFAINPEDHQPSGTCNFSRIDSAKLLLNSSGTIDTIYAVNYNILRIMSGMGGLAYAN